MNTPTILLIEDDLMLSNMYVEKFTLEGFRVLTSRNGEDGVRIAKEERPDLILLDLILPRLSGIDVLVLLNQDSNTKKIPVLVLTNVAEQNQSKKALKFGAKEYLVKAMYTPEEIVAKVKRYLNVNPL